MTLSGTERLSESLIRARQIKAQKQKIQSDYTDIVNVLNQYVDVATHQAINISQEIFENLFETIEQAREGGFLKEYLSDVSSEIIQQMESVWPVGDYAKKEFYSIEKGFSFWPNNQKLALDLGIGEKLENQPHESQSILKSTHEVFAAMLNDNAQRMKEEIQNEKDLMFLVEVKNSKREELDSKLYPFLNGEKQSRFVHLTPNQYRHVPENVITSAYKIEMDVAQLVAEAKNKTHTFNA